MSTKRNNSYFKSKKTTGTTPIKDKEEVAVHTDNKIDQDFPGFPHAQANTTIISPKTKQQKKVAAVDIKDGEKQDTDEQLSDGSGGAFSETEEVHE